MLEDKDEEGLEFEADPSKQSNKLIKDQTQKLEPNQTQRKKERKRASVFAYTEKEREWRSLFEFKVRKGEGILLK